MFDCRNEILQSCGDYLIASGLQKQDIQTVCTDLIIGFFSYDTKEILLNDILKSIRNNTPFDQPLLHCLAAILKKETQASDLLLQFVQSDQSLEMCIMLC